MDERIPPMVDDFLYVCDDAYTWDFWRYVWFVLDSPTFMDISPALSRRERFMVTERKVLSVVGFDVGFPLSYRLKYKYFCIFFDRELRDVFCQTRFPSLRYLRRYGRVCHISMPVLTLARLNQTHLTNIDIHLLLGIFWSLALWNTASTSKSVNQRWL